MYEVELCGYTVYEPLTGTWPTMESDALCAYCDCHVSVTGCTWPLAAGWTLAGDAVSVQEVCGHPEKSVVTSEQEFCTGCCCCG